jgi:hypothetical protein
MKFTKRETLNRESGGISNYLKLGDGQSVEGVFRGEVFEFYQDWPKGGMKKIYSEPTEGASLRFRANFVVYEDGKYIARVFDFGVTVYNVLADIAENYDIEKTKIKITRRGIEKQTQWMILPLGAIEAKILKSVALVELNVLNTEAQVEVDDDSQAEGF